MAVDHRPVTVWLTVNRECNFRCKWCYAQNTGYDRDVMNLELAKKLTTVAHQAGAKRVLLIGGEPSLWPHLQEYNQFAKQLGIRNSMVTNGFLFGVDNYWEKYQKYACDGYGVSLKAGNPEQLQAITKVKEFNTVKRGISRVAALHPTYISIVYGPDYADNIVEMVTLAMECGAKGVTIDFCRAYIENGKFNDQYLGSMTDAANEIVQNYEELNQITNGNLSIEMSMPFCVWPVDFIQKLISKNQVVSLCHVVKRNGLIFDTNGNLVMCNALFDFPLGRYGVDFDDGETLLRFLNSPTISSYYEKISSYPSLKCAECDWYDQCGGGCPLRWGTLYPDQVVKPIKLMEKAR